MRQQGQAGRVAVAAGGGRRGEPLIRRDVLDQSEHLRRERRLRHRRRAVSTNSGRNLHDVVIRQPAERPAVAHVDNLDVAAVGGQRRDQLDRGFAVEGSPAPPE